MSSWLPKVLTVAQNIHWSDKNHMKDIFKGNKLKYLGFMIIVNTKLAFYLVT